MRYSETGFNLEIDLTRGNIEKVETHPEDTELYLGGLGLIGKTIWDRIAPEIDAFSPENLLIFGTGLLVGTLATGATRTIVAGISPVTNLFGFSVMGSYWGAELKYAGYDSVIMRGKSPNPVYLWIHNDKVEIRDASHLGGKGAVETQVLIQQELNEPRAQVAAIGLAGENKVLFSTIEHDASSASRLGYGALMGDKNIKAIAVRGTCDIHIADPVEFMKIRAEAWKYMKQRIENPLPETPPINEKLGIPQEMSVHDEKWHAKPIPGFWSDEVEKQWTETMLSMRTRLLSCHNCPLQCKASISPPGQPTYMMKCFTKMFYAMMAFSDLDFNLKFAQPATEYGVDSMTTPQVFHLAINLLGAGILKEEDFPGLPPDMEGRFYYLLDKIVKREGIGDILAEGTLRAASKIGNGAEKFVNNTIKGHEQVGMSSPFFNPIYYLMFATGEKLDIRMMQGQIPQHAFSTKEVREEFAKDWVQAPNEKIKQSYVDWQRRSEGPNCNPDYPTVDIACEWVDWMEMMHYIDDSVGMCAGLSSWNQKPPFHLHNFPGLIQSATGITFDKEKLIKTTRRIRTLLRAINVRRGVRRVDDKPPDNYWAQDVPELKAELLNSYYKMKGWTPDSVPTNESLQGLGLEFVARDFEERGIFVISPDLSIEEKIVKDAAKRF